MISSTENVLPTPRDDTLNPPISDIVLTKNMSSLVGGSAGAPSFIGRCAASTLSIADFFRSDSAPFPPMMYGDSGVAHFHGAPT